MSFWSEKVLWLPNCTFDVYQTSCSLHEVVGYRLTIFSTFHNAVSFEVSHIHNIFRGHCHDMATKIDTQRVADAFVAQYYMILNECPKEVHKFYGESSLLGWTEHDGAMTTVTTLSGINDKILSSDCQKCLFDVKTVDAQASHDGGVIVAVAGSFIGKDEVTNEFFQTFFLARQERGFFVLNDILRARPITNVAVCAPTLQNSGNLSPSPTPSPTKASDEVEKIKEALDISVPKDSVAKDSPSSSSVDSIVTPDSDAVRPKITYASLVVKVAKEAKVMSPTITKTTPKASVPLVNGTPKDVPKASASSVKVATKLPTVGNIAPDTNPHVNARAVYIGRLPYNITKHGVVDVLKKFGPIRRYSDAVQIRQYQDGFCCGFVEFESADSARRAVEAHHVKFGENEAYITYKRSSYNRVVDQDPRQGVDFKTAVITSLIMKRVGLGILNGADPRAKGKGIRVETASRGQGRLAETASRGQGRLAETASRGQGRLAETASRAQGTLAETDQIDRHHEYRGTLN
ncbi:hypothetical protein OROGR_014921 [Orobanche gracilis]